MTRLMLTLATKLRITPKSNREGVYTAYSPASRRKPWEDDFLDDEPPRKKLWKPDDPNDGEPKPPVV